MQRKNFGWLLGLAMAACGLLTGKGQASAAVNIALVPVGNVGNVADPATGYGAVSYAYSIGEYDVTAAQYTAFLNAVASTSDLYGLYNRSMAPGGEGDCGILRTPVTGGYIYSVDAQHQNYPVNYVSWADAARFCNWLSNNQPTGQPEGNGTTETGSYTLNGKTSNADLQTVTRNTGATYVIPTENEWYKAAYYDPSLNNGAGGYWLYPTKSNTTPSNVLSATGTNNANFFSSLTGQTDSINDLTPVGAFAASPSAYGTFDQGGDVWQWNEAIFQESERGARGGSFFVPAVDFSSGIGSGEVPSWHDAVFGFRVAEVPEPTSVGVLGLGIIGMVVRRRCSRKSGAIGA